MCIIHSVNKEEFENEIKTGSYGRKSLEKFGFIHCSDLDTYYLVAPNFKEDLNDRLILLIDTEKILEQINSAKIKELENANMESVKQAKEKEIEKISNLKRGLYGDWKMGNITKEEYFEYKQKYEKEIEILKEIIVNLDKKKEKQEEVIDRNSKWLENFKKYKKVSELDRSILAELIDYIEVYENKKIKIHFKFMRELDKIFEQ